MDEDEKADEAKKETASKNRHLRALILGTIAAGGAFQLNGWQAQAHGNRSSGATQSIRTSVTPGDMKVVEKQVMPGANGVVQRKE